MAVRNQVDHLAVKYRVSFVARPSASPLTAAPFHAPLHHQPQQPSSVAPVASVPPPSAPSAPVSVDSLLGRGALAALLNRQSATPQPQPVSTPQIIPATIAALRSPTPQRAEPQKPATPDPMALLASLRGAGLLPPPTPQQNQTPLSRPLAAPPPPAAATTAAPSTTTTPVPARGGLDLASILAKAQSIAATAKAVPVLSRGDISFTTASLKKYVHNITLMLLNPDAFALV